MLRYLNEVSAVTKRILTELLHSGRSLKFWIIFPALMLLLFGLIYADGETTGNSFDSTTPGILIGAAMFFSCLGGPVALIVSEREHLTLRRLLVSPISPASYFLGIVMAHIIIAGGQSIIVYGISYLFGGRFHGSLLLGVAIICMSVFSFVGMGFFFGARFTRRTEDVNGPVAAFGVPLLVLGGTFFPVNILPSYLFYLSHLNPIFHMNQALKAVSAQGLAAGDILLNLGILGACMILSMVAGIQSYKQILIKEKTM